ncbi:DUF6233 domain-containing protein [Streptomyces indonesiensis]
MGARKAAPVCGRRSGAPSSPLRLLAGQRAHARVTTEDAIGLLAQQGMDICDICRPDRALRR